MQKIRYTMNDILLQSEDDETGNGFTAIAETVKPHLKKPSMYMVLLLNDDYTPMEFVVEVLQSFFSLDKEHAVRVMLQVHTKGKGVCGIYTREVAETKAGVVNSYARENEHPLLCDIEPSEDSDDS